MWVRRGAYPRVEELKGASLGLALVGSRLAMEKRSSLLWKVLTYGRKKVYDIGPRLPQQEINYDCKFFKFNSWANFIKRFSCQSFSLLRKTHTYFLQFIMFKWIITISYLFNNKRFVYYLFKHSEEVYFQITFIKKYNL